MALAWSYSTSGLDWDELCALYEASPPMGGKNVPDLKTSFGNSMFTCFVHDGGKLVGAGRALADGVACAYIADVAVLPGYRGIGLGKQVVAELLRLSAGHKRIILYSVPAPNPSTRNSASAACAPRWRFSPTRTRRPSAATSTPTDPARRCRMTPPAGRSCASSACLSNIRAGTGRRC
jgi:GNAT superfamily N-acetyltransferase